MHPQLVLANLCRFIGVEFDPGMLSEHSWARAEASARKRDLEGLCKGGWSPQTNGTKVRSAL